MLFIIITIIMAVITFHLNPLLKKVSLKNSSGLHIHHSVLGLAILILGLLFKNYVVASIGLGIYIGHVAEEMYFNKRSLLKASLVFVTRDKP
jgi:hypothetical protein